MPTRVSKKKLADMEDSNSMAARIVAQATSQQSLPAPQSPMPEKNAAAVALGKLGASKGGIARAKSLSAKERKAIARKAANSRWR